MAQWTAALRAGEGGIGPWRATLAGACATLMGFGLARFAYTPLLPALVEAGWFTAGDAAYLGAANLAGYLAGAVLGRGMAARMPVPWLLRAMMLLAAASFFACAAPLSFLWYFVWRFASGLAGAVLMVVGLPAVLQRVPKSRQGLAGGAMFAAVGVGIVASGTLVPLLIQFSLVAAWSGIGALALVLVVLSWHSWPDARLRAPTAPPPTDGVRLAGPVLSALYVEYALTAVGLVPHMIFLVDFIARGLGAGVETGGVYWVLFGVGAITGPMLVGHAADRIGFGRGIRLAFVIQAVAVGWLAVDSGPVGLVVSSLVMGAFVPGIVTLVLGRVGELTPDPDARQAAWSIATVGFAVGQAVAAYGFSFLFERTGNYAALFALAAGALVLALTLDLVVNGLAARRRRVQLERN